MQRTLNPAYQAAQSLPRSIGVDFLNLLDAQRTLLKCRLEERRTTRDHRQHLAQLEGAVGRALPKEPLKLSANEGENEQ